MYVLTSGKQVKQWPGTDMMSSLTLHNLSTKTSRYLRESIKLPDISTLNSWIADINVEPGILKSVIKMVNIKRSSLLQCGKSCIISFDEMKIDSKHSNDKGLDTIYKPHNYVQVGIVRGIIEGQKWPLFYNYDWRMTKEFLLDISVIEDAVFPVCDMGGANQGLLRSLGVTEVPPNFANPCNDNKVHVFADVPHLLKLIKNNLVDHGIETPY